MQCRRSRMICQELSFQTTVTFLFSLLYNKMDFLYNKMDSVDQTLRRARQVEEKFKKFMQRKVQHDKSIEETLKKIDRTQQSLNETKKTISSIDDLYNRIQKVMSDSIDNAVASYQKSTMISIADLEFQPNRVTAKQVAEMLKDKKKIMFLTGAGISAASGIPTFRGDGGFWSKQQIEVDPSKSVQEINPQILLTNAFYQKHPEKTWEWLRRFYTLKAKSKPNKGHFALSEIIETFMSKGKEVCIVTQNIDNFHNEAKDQRIAKNKKIKDYPIHEIHGNILKIRCDNCSNQSKKLYTEPFQAYLDILQMKPLIHCPRCQHIFRPHIMFFDEFYQQLFHHADTVRQFLKETDALVVIGTSLSTGMANGIVTNAIENEKQVVEINAACEIKKKVVWWMQDKSEEVLEALKVQVIKK